MKKTIVDSINGVSNGFKTIDTLGNDLDIPLIGMPAEHSWILYASFNDKSFLREALTWQLLAGAALIISSIAVVNWKPVRAMR